jgi:predicted DNA-binding protein
MADKTTKKPGKPVASGEKWIAVRVSDATKERLEAWATKTGSSVSFVMRRLADEALANNRDEGGIP